MAHCSGCRHRKAYIASTTINMLKVLTDVTVDVALVVRLVEVACKWCKSGA
jgi:hypothetical protein